MNNLIKAKSILLNGDFTCVICKDDTIYTSALRGVKPLVNWYGEGLNVEGFSAADKVVGKATAFLYVLLGVRAVFAGVISKSALKVLTDNTVRAEYDTLSDYIINRTGDGICPFEKAVNDITEPEEAYKVILEKTKELRVNSTA